MFQTGMGPSHVNTFLAALEVPGLHYKAMRDRQKEVSKAIEYVAETSCANVLQQECTLTKLNR